jgi:hypothetical protein
MVERSPDRWPEAEAEVPLEEWAETRLRHWRGRALGFDEMLFDLADGCDTAYRLFRLCGHLLYERPDPQHPHHIGGLFVAGNAGWSPAGIALAVFTRPGTPLDPEALRLGAERWLRRRHRGLPAIPADDLAGWNGRLIDLDPGTPGAVRASLERVFDLYVRAGQEANRDPRVVAANIVVQAANLAPGAEADDGALARATAAHREARRAFRVAQRRALHQLLGLSRSRVALI